MVDIPRSTNQSGSVSGGDRAGTLCILPQEIGLLMIAHVFMLYSTQTKRIVTQRIRASSSCPLGQEKKEHKRLGCGEM